MGTPDRRGEARSQADDVRPRSASEALQDLQKENETLKELVVSLSELVIKRVADQR